MRTLTTPSRSTHASFWRRPIEPAGTGVSHCSICALYKMHPIKEEREERVKNQAQRRPATGRLLCLIFLDRAAGAAQSADKRRRPMRIASRAGNGAQEACAEKKQTKFLGENFRETLKHILKNGRKTGRKNQNCENKPSNWRNKSESTKNFQNLCRKRLTLAGFYGIITKSSGARHHEEHT